MPTVYKMVRVVHSGELISYNIPYYKRYLNPDLSLIYIPGEKTLPVNGRPLFAFADKASAVLYRDERNGLAGSEAFQVWEAEAEGVKTCPLFGPAWAEDAFFDFENTVLCDSITLLRKIK